MQITCSKVFGAGRHLTNELTRVWNWCVVQDVFNLLPNLNMEELTKSFAVKCNDMMLVIYLSSMVRSVLALHNLIDNKEERLWKEKEAAGSEEKKLTARKAEKAKPNGKLEETGEKM
jgi:26S proteasome regulatory subunit N8